MEPDAARPTSGWSLILDHDYPCLEQNDDVNNEADATSPMGVAPMPANDLTLRRFPSPHQLPQTSNSTTDSTTHGSGNNGEGLGLEVQHPSTSELRESTVLGECLQPQNPEFQIMDEVSPLVQDPDLHHQRISLQYATKRLLASLHPLM
jgi:hypothetical protein